MLLKNFAEKVLQIRAKFEIALKSLIFDTLESLLSSCISTRRQSYSTQQVLFKLLDKRKQNRDNVNALAGFLIHPSKKLDRIPHNLTIAK